jgi:mannosyl-3-phosphoglycerate phosphatase
MNQSSENPQIIVFTDLDGTLLDRDTYSPQKARSGLENLKTMNIPVIFISSKTRLEQEEYRQMLGISDPFVVEDGGAIYIGKNYFDFEYPVNRVDEDYCVIEIGQPYKRIRSVLERIKSKTGIEIKGYGDLGENDISRITGMKKEFSSKAKAREYQETLISKFEGEDLEILEDNLAKFGLRLSQGGRFQSVLANNNKGLAVSILANFFKMKYSKILTVGLGDSTNDISMLEAVDLPVLVQKPDFTWENFERDGLVKIEGVGPEGWNNFIRDFLAGKYENLKSDPKTNNLHR